MKYYNIDSKIWDRISAGGKGGMKQRNIFNWHKISWTKQANLMRKFYCLSLVISGRFQCARKVLMRVHGTNSDPRTLREPRRDSLNRVEDWSHVIKRYCNMILPWGVLQVIILQVISIVSNSHTETLQESLSRGSWTHEMYISLSCWHFNRILPFGNSLESDNNQHDSEDLVLKREAFPTS